MITETPTSDPDAVPTAKTLAAVWKLPVRDRTGREIPFGDIVAGPDASTRVLVFFIRHWFCPVSICIAPRQGVDENTWRIDIDLQACQGYIRKLAAIATPKVLSSLPIKTTIAIVGSGGPQLIDHWVKESACPYPVYTDPSIRLYKTFKFLPDKGQGESEYHKLTPMQGFLKSASQIVRMAQKLHHGGHPFQNGGELLFEPVSSSEGAEKQVTWCHRMQHATDHAKFVDVLKVLGIEAKMLSVLHNISLVSGGFLSSDSS